MNGTMTVGESSTDSLLDAGVWVYAGVHAVERSAARQPGA